MRYKTPSVRPDCTLCAATTPLMVDFAIENSPIDIGRTGIPHVPRYLSPNYENHQ